MKKLKLEHIACYLPYRLKAYYPYKTMSGVVVENKIFTIDSIVQDGRGYPYWTHDKKFLSNTSFNGKGFNTSDFKPILRPLSDLTKEELKNQGFETHIDYLTHEKGNPIFAPYQMVEYLFSQHFDIFNLIDQDLAIDINKI